MRADRRQDDRLLRDPVEHLPVDEVAVADDRRSRRRRSRRPVAGLRSEDVRRTRRGPPDPGRPGHFPEGRRLRTTLVDAQLTSADGDTHVLSLGEFAALYLTVWSPAIWGEKVIGAGLAPDSSKPQQQQPLRWDQELPLLEKGKPLTGAIVMPRVEFPDTVAGHLYVAPDEPPKPLTPDEKEEAAYERQKSLRGVRRARRVPQEPAQGAARAGQRADVHDPRRSRRHRRLLPQPDLARPRARHAARPGAPRQRDDRLRAVPGLGQRPAGLPQRSQGRAARPRARPLPGGPAEGPGRSAVREIDEAARPRRARADPDPGPAVRPRPTRRSSGTSRSTGRSTA